MSPHEGMPPLDADVDELSAVLSETLVRQEGPELAALVDRVRGAIGGDRAAADALLAGLDAAGATRLARATSTCH